MIIRYLGLWFLSNLGMSLYFLVEENPYLYKGFKSIFFPGSYLVLPHYLLYRIPITLTLAWMFYFTLNLKYDWSQKRVSRLLYLKEKSKTYECFMGKGGTSCSYMYHFLFLDENDEEIKLIGQARDYTFLEENTWYHITSYKKMIEDMDYVQERFSI